MTLCPIALVAGCKKCPIFSVCPLKTVIGDHVPEAPKAGGTSASGRDSGPKAAPKRKR
jgi:hypothetical protein